MHDMFHILRPADVRWILRAGNNKFLFRHTARGFAHKFLNRGLAIWRVSTHVAHITGKPGIGRELMMLAWINRTIERHREGCSELLLKLLKHRAAGKAEVNIQFRKMGFKQVISAS